MSITAHDHHNSHDRLDNDDSAIPTFDNRQRGDFSTEQFSQELRLVSPGGDRLRYTLGLFFNTTKFDRTFNRGPLFSIARWAAANGSDQLSGISQLEYDVLPSTTLIAGARYSRERIDYTFNDLVAARIYGGHSVDYFGTYKLGLQHKFAADITGFLTYATGHKGEAYGRPLSVSSWTLGARWAARSRRQTERLARARAEVDSAKVALGERGPVWWNDGSEDMNRHLVRNTRYASWYEALGDIE
ncbi:TonB-dependent receptor [Sphingomonas sp. BIUV-7]|uniref:TonB-dependent receptor n=1 Tax=Sphingomonas natans TaxID=3063330 RepID=A0ABT8YDA1_9SPHN|nr:TonB-dependent receptor [Sphingomonas sp. BIUV-7]MDO6416299.1 TonB-dependent receptor [Sphingomonas sp. BIUV-7]